MVEMRYYYNIIVNYYYNQNILNKWNEPLPYRAW